MKRILIYQNKYALPYISKLFFGILLGCCLFFSNNLQAQNYCSTPDDFSPSAGFDASFSNMNEQGPFFLKLYVHVISDANGVGGQTPQAVENAVAILQQDFNPHNIYFVWDCYIDCITDDTWFQGPNQNGNTTGIYNVNNHYDGLDMYLFPDVANSNGGRANGVGGSSEFWVAGTLFGQPVASNSIVSHEMGHCINLWHTFHGCETGNWEDTDGSDCTIAGDFVCDTPSDPHIAFNVNPTTCEWTGVAACNPPEPISNYDPDEQIIMAYTRPECMAYFTNGQGQRMRNSIANLPYLQATETTPLASSCANSCPDNLTISDNFNNGDIVDFQTSNWINSTSKIYNGADINYTTGNQIRLLPNFRAYTGSNFRASIASCSSNKTAYNHVANNELEQVEDISFNIFPNPFTDQTNIEYHLPNASIINISVFDLTGRKVAQLEENTLKEQGKHSLTFDGSQLTKGIYHIHIQSEQYQTTQKVVVTH